MKVRKKGFISSLLCMALILTAMVQPTAAHAEGEEKATAGKESIVYELCQNIETHRGTNKSAPYEKRGYVFAGWYKADSNDQEFGGYSPLTEAEADTAGSAYAKFVDEKVLQVKFQLRAGTTSEDENTALRMVTTVDSLAYRSVGFVINFNEKSAERNSTTVYDTIKGYTSDGVNSYTPREAFECEISKYFLSLNITNIKKDLFSENFTITPTWTTLDGTVVTGSARDVMVQDVYIQKYNDSDRVFHYSHGAGVSMADLEGKALQFKFKITSTTGQFDLDFMDDKNDWANITGTLVIEKAADGKITSNIGKIVEAGDGWYAWQLNRDEFAGNGVSNAQIVDLAFQQNEESLQGNVLIDWGSLCAVEAYDIRDVRAEKYTSETDFYKNFNRDVITREELNGKALHLEFKFTTETGRFGFDVMDKDWRNITGNGADKVIIEKTSEGITASMGRIIELENGWYAWELNSDQFKGDGWAKATGVGVFYHQDVFVTGEVLADWESLCAVEAYDIRDVRAEKYTSETDFYKNFNRDVITREELNGKALHLEFKFTTETGRFGFDVMDKDWRNITGNGADKVIIEKTSEGITASMGRIIELENGWYAWELNSDQFKGDGWAKATGVGVIFHQGVAVTGEVLVDWESLKVVEAYQQ